MINIGRAIKNLLNKKQDTIIAIPGVLGDKTGVVNTDRKNYVYARVGNAVISVFNNRVNAQYGLPVMIGYDPAQPGLLQVLSTRDITGDNTQYQVPAHHENHEYPYGNDIVYMQLRQFLPLRITPLGGFKVAIYRAIVWGNGFKVVNDTLDLFQYCPVQPYKACYVLITVSNDGNINVTKGNEVDISTLSLSDIPQIPATAKYVIGAIRLYSSQNEIKESGTDTDIVDLRYPIWHTHSSNEISNLIVYKKFTELEDTPSAYAGYGGKAVKVKTTEDGLEFGNIPFSFLDLNDTPSSYNNQAGKFVSVKTDASGLDFSAIYTHNGPGTVFRVDGALVAVNNVCSFVAPSDGIIEAVYIYCQNTGTVGQTIVDCNKNGTTIFTNQSNRPTLDYNDGDKIAKSGVPDITQIAENDVLTFDIDDAASGAKDLTIVLAVKWTVTHSTKHVIQNNGNNLPDRNGLNFVGFRTQDDSTNNATVVRATMPPWMGNIITPPKLNDFTWINQETATVTEYEWGIHIYDQPGSGVRWRILAKPLNNTSNYRITLGLYTFLPFYDYYNAGILLLDNDNKIFSNTLYRTRSIIAEKWNSPTSWNSNYIELQLYYPQPIWLRVEDDGTNRKSYYSYDGINFIQYHSVSRTDFLTPTKVGFGLDVENTSYPGAITVIHWKEEPL